MDEGAPTSEELTRPAHSYGFTDNPSNDADTALTLLPGNPRGSSRPTGRTPGGRLFGYCGVWPRRSLNRSLPTRIAKTENPRRQTPPTIPYAQAHAVSTVDGWLVDV
jgi:hypothetical protein